MDDDEFSLAYAEPPRKERLASLEYLEPITWEEIVQNDAQDYILVGESGIGKTSFLHWIGKQVSKRIESEFIPLFISLKEIAEFKTEDGLLAIINRDYKLKDYDLEGKRLLFLLDGLDQVPELNLGNIANRLYNKDIFGKGNKIILVTRPVGYEWIKENFTHEYLCLLPFDDQRIKDYIGKDYNNTQFKAILDQNEELLRIPILLRMVKKLLSRLSEIKNRVDLYQKFINYLFEEWQVTIIGTPLANTTAIKVQEDLAMISYQAMVRNHRGSFPFKMGMEKGCLDEKSLNDLILWSVTHNLIEKDEKKVIAYTHQSFQEYFAACWLNSQKPSVQRKQIQEMLKNPALWQETIRFFFNLLGNTDSVFCEKLLEEVNQFALSKKDKALILLSAQCLTDFKCAPLHKRIKTSLQKVRDKSHGEPQLFLACGDALGLLDEPKIDVANPQMVYFAPEKPFNMGSNKYENEQPIHQVKLSPYYLGKYPVTNKEFSEFIKAGGYEKEEYWFDEDEQFRFDAREFLRSLKDKEKAPRWWLDDKFGKSRPLAPVVGVSWYEAMAYCRWWTLTYGVRWLATALENIHPITPASGKSTPLPPASGGYCRVRMRLPTEAEWEFAARGFEGREYPWGNPEPSPERVNYDNRLKQTSTVGSYPAGATKEGVFDMAGNVWEWCYDRYGSYEQRFDENPVGPAEGGWCVLRGAPWSYFYPEPFRGGNRNYNYPEDRLSGLGLRVARTVTI